MQTALFILSILGGGFVFGALARRIVPSGPRLSWGETTLVGIAGAAVGALLGTIVTPGEASARLGPWPLIGVLVGSVLVLVVVTTVLDRLGLRPEVVPWRPVVDLVASGEGQRLEFKQSARHNIHTAERDPRIELAIARTVAGFLNAEGGTLLIGVADDGTPVGLDDDLALMKAPDLDRYELWVADHLQRCLGNTAVAGLSTSFEVVDGRQICRIEAPAAAEPVFLDEPGGQRRADMYVRMGNSTRKLLTDEAISYSRNRWGRRRGGLAMEQPTPGRTPSPLAHPRVGLSSRTTTTTTKEQP